MVKKMKDIYDFNSINNILVHYGPDASISEKDIALFPSIRDVQIAELLKINIDCIGFNKNARTAACAKPNTELIKRIRRQGYKDGLGSIYLVKSSVINKIKEALNKLNKEANEADIPETLRIRISLAVSFFEKMFEGNSPDYDKFKDYYVIDGNTRFEALLLSYNRIEGIKRETPSYHNDITSGARAREFECDRKNHDIVGLMTYRVITDKTLKKLREGTFEYFDVLAFLALYRDNNSVGITRWPSISLQVFDANLFSLIEYTLFRTFRESVSKKKKNPVSIDYFTKASMDMMAALYPANNFSKAPWFFDDINYLRTMDKNVLNENGKDKIKTPSSEMWNDENVYSVYKYTVQQYFKGDERAFERLQSFIETLSNDYIDNKVLTQAVGVEGRFFMSKVAAKVKKQPIRDYYKWETAYFKALNAVVEKMKAERRNSVDDAFVDGLDKKLNAELNAAKNNVEMLKALSYKLEEFRMKTEKAITKIR